VPSFITHSNIEAYCGNAEMYYFICIIMYKYTQFQIKIVDLNKIYHNLENLQNEIQDLCSSGMLCIVDLESVTNISGQPIGLIFKGQAVL
jgi:hypothetical protein